MFERRELSQGLKAGVAKVCVSYVQVLELGEVFEVDNSRVRDFIASQRQNPQLSEARIDRSPPSVISGIRDGKLLQSSQSARIPIPASVIDV